MNNAKTMIIMHRVLNITFDKLLLLLLELFFFKTIGQKEDFDNFFVEWTIFVCVIL